MMGHREKYVTTRFDAAATLDTPEAITEYLAAAMETNDAAYIAKAARQVTVAFDVMKRRHNALRKLAKQ